jgi:hypothetical protein
MRQLTERRAQGGPPESRSLERLDRRVAIGRVRGSVSIKFTLQNHGAVARRDCNHIERKTMPNLLQLIQCVLPLVPPANA